MTTDAPDDQKSRLSEHTQSMIMTTSEVLAALFELPEASSGDDLVTFLKQHGPPPAGDEGEDPFRRLMRVATRAERRSAASIAGHQAAIRRLFPATPPDAICAFCISEDRGPHPKYINTSLVESPSGLRLNGTKRWGSVAPDADLLYVAASIGREGDRNDLRMIALPADRPGVTLDLEPYVDYGPEMRIADITFDDVQVHPGEVIQGDAYVNYIKPFRLIEDVYNTVGTQVAMFRLGTEYGWEDERLETLAALISQAAAVSSTDMASPEAILLLTAYLRSSGEFWAKTWQSWPDAPAEVIAKWSPDRSLLGVAERARETRRQTAWAELRP